MAEQNEKRTTRARGTSRGTVHPRSDSGKTGEGVDKVDFRGYVNLTLNDTDKRLFDEWLSNVEAVAGGINTVIEGGYRLSVSFDKRHDCFTGSLYCQVPGEANAGYSLSIKGGDVFTAIQRVFFVHLVVLGGQWPTADNKAPYNPDDWT